MGRYARALALAVATAGATAAVAGCGMPAAPQPPSLELPEPVADLTATRAGNQVALAWTMPKRDTSKVNLTADVAAKVCRREAGAACAVIATLHFAPGASATFTDGLSATLAAGDPRPLNYFVELVNKRGRSAGMSNEGAVLAGQAPASVANLSGELRKDGVALRWTPGPPEPYATQMRLERTLLTPSAAKPAQGPLAEPAEPTKKNLLVPSESVRGGALDKDVHFGETYEYRAQRIARIAVNGKDLELDGPFSTPLRVEVKDIFPPAVPIGLAAVATPGENGAGSAIDLSWQPNTDADLAGYAVYRRDAAPEAQVAGEWQRISGPQPLAGPGFHDVSVQPGHTYEYAVTATSQNGHESVRSGPTQEAVPAQ